jgi:flagella basal body P-ring formation protein FlgA
MRAFFLFFQLLAALWYAPLLAAEADPILDAAERHVRMQTQGLAGTIQIRLAKPETSRLPPCNAYEAFTPPGGRLMGRTHVGVRCLGPSSWNIMVGAEISVSGTYVTTARPILAGQAIQAADLITQTGDVSSLPTGFISDPAQAIGKTLRNALGAGQILRADRLLAPLVIQQGQVVKVISRGDGFAVTAEGRALTNAGVGQTLQVRMNSGQTVSGIARADASVELNF